VYDHIQFLNEVSYDISLIGLAELRERRAVLRWLNDQNNGFRDPREESGETSESREASDFERPNVTSQAEGTKIDDPADRWTHLVVLTHWVFTVGDADCYPSVPHGHLQKKTNPWPKLNPYTGRVFSSMHTEDKSRRLTRSEMQIIWNDEKFLELCYKQIEWYSEFAPDYQYVKAKYGKFVFPRW
jgi:hypothetical protein